MVSQQEKYAAFKALHVPGAAFVMPNAWDAGSARVLSHLGARALATTSAGYAFAAGKRDSFGGLTRDEILANAAAIVGASALPVSADLEDGFGAAPEACGETVRMATAIGLVGGAIEDATGEAGDPIYGFDQAVERIRAASEGARGAPFLLTARAENYLYGRPDLGDTIRRLQAFSEAGADVLYAPGLPDLERIGVVCREVDKPVNVVMGLSGLQASAEALGGVGVARISTGGSLARAGWGAVWRAMEEMLTAGTFTYADDAVPDADMAALMAQDKVEERG